MRRLIACLWLGLVLAVAVPGAAEARWLKAESERFIVYSDGDEGSLRQYVQKLETFDRLLRLSMGLAVDEAPPRKLPVYLVSDRRALTRISPGLGDSVVGFYSPASEDIFAAAIRTRGEDDTLLHEYAHHFMWQNFAASYPSWFSEGFAEYYMTADIDPGKVSVGEFNENRAYWLQAEDWIDLRDLLTKRPGQMSRDRDQATYYPVAWLLTHWFMGNQERRGQLNAYLDDVQAGGDPIEAMERATGLNPTQLKATLRRYMNGRIPYSVIQYDFPQVPVTITALPRSADDLLLIGQSLKIGVPEEDRAKLASDVRQLAARHPEDSFARLTLGHAELHFGNRAEGEAILQALVTDEPENVEALQLMASARMYKAGEDGVSDEDSARLLREARGFLARAYRVDSLNYYTLYLIAQTRRSAADYPTDNDILTWENAHVLAPQLSGIRLGVAEVYLIRDRSEEAIALLQPLANDPHGRGGSSAARALIEEARAIQAGLAVAPTQAIEEADPDEDQDEPAEGDPTGAEPELPAEPDADALGRQLLR